MVVARRAGVVAAATAGAAQLDAPPALLNWTLRQPVHVPVRSSSPSRQPRPSRPVCPAPFVSSAAPRSSVRSSRPARSVRRTRPVLPVRLGRPSRLVRPVRPVHRPVRFTRPVRPFVRSVSAVPVAPSRPSRPPRAVCPVHWLAGPSGRLSRPVPPRCPAEDQRNSEAGKFLRQTAEL